MAKQYSATASSLAVVALYALCVTTNISAGERIMEEDLQDPNLQKFTSGVPLPRNPPGKIMDEFSPSRRSLRALLQKFIFDANKASVL